MVDGMSFPRAITNEVLHCGQIYSESTRGSSRRSYHLARGRAILQQFLYSKSPSFFVLLQITAAVVGWATLV